MTSSQTDSKTPESRLARHLAAHTVAALRAGFRVEHVTLDKISETESGVRCDWRQARNVYGDDIKLIKRSFALAYIGGLMDQESTSDFSDLHLLELKLDMVASETSRETAVAWNLVPAVRDTNPFAHSGYKLASRLIRQDRALIEDLATTLMKRINIDESALFVWFQETAIPFPLEDLEKTDTY